MGESLESPVFGTKVGQHLSQRNVVRGLIGHARDELENASYKQPPSHIFKKQLRHFSFNESEHSSFPSSYNTSINRQESLNSNNTTNSNRTSNFNVLKTKRISGSSGNKSSNNYKNPIGFKNHLKSIAQIVGVDKNMLNLPYTAAVTVRLILINI